MNRLSILYLEESTSVPSEYIVPLLSRTVDVTLVTGESLIPRGSYVGVRTLPMPRYPLQHLLRLTYLAERILGTQRIDLVHAHASVNALLRTTVPVIAHNHGSWRSVWRLQAERTHLIGRPRLLPGYLHYVIPESLAVRRASHVIVPSLAVKEEFQQSYGLPEERITVVPNAVPEDLWTRPPTSKSDNPVQILCAGRLHPLKGIVEFVRRFIRSPIPARVVVVGDGPERKELERLAAKDHRVRALGWLPRGELWNLMTVTSIFVFPSLYEGFSMALLEAMATGHACVAMRIPSVVELLSNGVGFICDTMDEMVDAVAKLVFEASVRTQLQLRAVSRARQYQWSSAVDRILQTYEVVLSRARSMRLQR